MVGHELSHGWWHWSAGGFMLGTSEAERAAFSQEQFRGQLENYVHPFDDAFGVLTAYDAFKLAMQNRPQETIDGFTPEQRFFLGVAWGNRGGPVSISPIASGQSRWRVMVNGVLSTLSAFSQAFDCKPGDPMAGGQIWYKEPWHDVVLSAEQRDEMEQDYELTLRKLISGNGADPFAEADAAADTMPFSEHAMAFTERRRTYDAERRALLGEPRRGGDGDAVPDVSTDRPGTG